MSALAAAQLEPVLARIARALGDVAAACAPVPAGPERLAEAAAAPGALLGEERALYVRFRSPRRRAQFLAGRSAVRRAVAAALGQPGAAAALEIGQGSTGSPVVKGLPDLQVSISHSHGLAVAVAAPFPVGVDLELDEPRPDALARYFLTSAEHVELAAAPAEARQGLVSVLWTRKEAAAKVGGWGGRIAFAALDCSREAVTISGRRIALRSASAAGYALSVAGELGGG